MGAIMHRQLGQLFDNSAGEGTAAPFPKRDASQSIKLANESDRDSAIADEQQGSVPLDELLRVHDYERQRMGHELHDSTGQLLTSLELSIAHFKEVEGDCPHFALISEIQQTVREIEQEIRTLAFLDYPTTVVDHDLGRALQSLGRGLQQRTTMHIEVKVLGEMAPLKEEVSLPMLRVAQEALTNVFRHAHASTATIVLKIREGSVELSISDDGVGMRSAAASTTTPGIGLRGMRHRIESLGGRLKITELKRGTRVSAYVPIAA
jgi:signal transduction histidine kinase